MARSPQGALAGPVWLALSGPWPLALAGLALTLLGGALSALPAEPPRFFVLAAGLLTTGVGVGRRLRATAWADFQERMETAGLVGVLGVAGAVAYFASGKEWTSARLFCVMLVLASLVGSMLVLMPTLPRKVVLSALVVFHFLGMVVAVTNVDPGPWLSKQLWARVYQPYLSFFYMTNAYHFYSPNPGDTPMLWFAVHYDDGTWKWHKVPDISTSPVGMHYQRMLALPQHVFASSGQVPYTDALLRTREGREMVAALQKEHARKVKKDAERGERPRRPTLDSWEEVQRRRQAGSKLDFGEYRIPVVRDIAPEAQYLEPADHSKVYLASVAKHVFHHAPAPDNPGAKVKSVKVYRVQHSVVTPAEFGQGVSAVKRNKFIAHFMGEFDGNGHLLGPYDPFLYWYLPILMVPNNYTQPAHGVPEIAAYAPEPTTGGKWLDCLEMHAAARYDRAGKGDKR